MSKPLLGAFLAVFLAGCTYSEFTPYQGAQQNWPTAPGAFVDSKHTVPVFYGPPPRPYKVLGYLSISNARSKNQSLAAAASQAKRSGGDAVIMIQTGSETAGVYSTGSAVATGGARSATATGYGISVPIQAVTSSVAVIKFL